MCECCNKEIFIKVPKVMKSIIAPVTTTAVIIDEIEDILGFKLMKLPKQFCPMCGRKLGDEDK